MAEVEGRTVPPIARRLPASFSVGESIDWDSPLVEVSLNVELPFWLMIAPGPVTVEALGAPFTVEILEDRMEVFEGELTDSRRSYVFQGAWSEEIIGMAGLGERWMARRAKTVLGITAHAHENAFADAGEGDIARAAYRASLCEAHIPVINELIRRYRLATYDYFAYEVSPWDVPIWYLDCDSEGFRCVLLTYKDWDTKPLIADGEEASPFEFASAADLAANPSSTASPGEFDLLDARNLMERGDYSGSVRRTVTAIEAILEAALLTALEQKYGAPEATERLEKSRGDFPGRVRQWLKLAKPSVGQDRFDRFEETRDLRHQIVHEGRRLGESDRGKAQRMVDTGRWLYNEIEQQPERKQLREFAKGAVLRSLGRSEMTLKFPASVVDRKIVLRPFAPRTSEPAVS
jgi:hypothetical protein